MSGASRPDLPVVPLSELTRSQVRAVFDSDDGAAATAMLEARCGAGLPLVKPEWTRLIDRIRAATIKLSGGDIERLRLAIDSANVDWRDVLVAAGFANDLEAHVTWSRSLPDAR